MANKQQVKGHKLSPLFSNKFPKYIEKIAEPFLPNEEHIYHASSAYQGKGGWFKTPWTILRDR